MTRAPSVFGAMAIGIAIAGAAFGTNPVSAQDSPGDEMSEQLDRIERKLDQVMKRLGEPATANEPVAAGATILPAPEDGKPATTSPDAPRPAGAAETYSGGYKAGAVAIVRAAPQRPNALSEIPGDSVGSFVYVGGAIPLNELSRSGVRYTGVAAVELQGWLKVTEPGRTQIGVEYRATTGSNAYIPASCIASVWLEDRSIGSERGDIPMPAREQKTISLVMGADLQPGLYRLRVWSACTPPRDVRQLNAELLIKSPSDMNLRTITSGDLLHQGG